jgi:hypothetical protein
MRIWVSFAVLLVSIVILDSFNATALVSVLVVPAHGSLVPIVPIRVGATPEWRIEFVYGVHNKISEAVDSVNMGDDDGQRN